MSIIKQDQKRLDNIAKAYWNTSGEMREMWGRKWYCSQTYTVMLVHSFVHKFN